MRVSADLEPCWSHRGWSPTQALRHVSKGSGPGRGARGCGMFWSSEGSLPRFGSTGTVSTLGFLNRLGGSGISMNGLGFHSGTVIPKDSPGD